VSADRVPPTRLPGRWFRVAATVPVDREDAWAGLAWATGARGTDGRPAGPGRMRVTAWFDREEDARRFARGLPEWVEGTEGPGEIADPGWLEASLAPREPIPAGRFLVVSDPADVPRDDPRTSLLLPPGRAFGTGEHETTRMCLELLGETLRPGDRVLDLGTGSGILAIGAARGGAGLVVGLDDDPTVLEVARENARLNGCADRIALAAGSWGTLARETRFDLLLANVHRTALVRGAGPLAGHLAADSRAVLSGFPPADVDRVVGAWISRGFRPVSARTEGEWAALLLVRTEEEA